jgi:hypothetical protein
MTRTSCIGQAEQGREEVVLQRLDFRWSAVWPIPGGQPGRVGSREQDVSVGVGEEGSQSLENVQIVVGRGISRAPQAKGKPGHWEGIVRPSW